MQLSHLEKIDIRVLRFSFKGFVSSRLTFAILAIVSFPIKTIALNSSK